MKRGDLARMTSFTHHNPPGDDLISIGFKAPKGQVSLFMLLGEEDKKKPTDPLSGFRLLVALGWRPIDEETWKALQEELRT